MKDKYNKKIEEMSKEMGEKYTKKFEEMSKSVNEIPGNQEKNNQTGNRNSSRFEN